MKGWVFVMLMIGVPLAACDQASPEQEPVGESPIASFDKTRLWILVQGSRIGDGRICADYFRARDDPRYNARAKKCEAWTLDFTDYLRLNGLPTLQPAHLRGHVYWEWFETTKQSILDCQQKYVPKDFNAKETGEQRHQRTKAKYACDPYADARKNKKLKPEELGIRFTDKADHTQFEDMTLEELLESTQ